MESFSDAILGNLDVVCVFGGEGTVFKGGGEEVDDGESETLFGVRD